MSKSTTKTITKKDLLHYATGHEPPSFRCNTWGGKGRKTRSDEKRRWEKEQE